jgi:hypothetical protein
VLRKSGRLGDVAGLVMEYVSEIICCGVVLCCCTVAALAFSGRLGGVADLIVNHVK